MFQERLASEMKRRRAEKGLTQEKLAELIDKSSTFIGQLERQTVFPRVETLELIIDYLDLDANYLFGLCSPVDEDCQKMIGLMSQMNPDKRQMLLKIAAVIVDSK